MSLQSDLKLNISRFDPKNITPGTKALNDGLVSKLENAPGWWEIGVSAARQARLEGKGPFPPPTYLPQGVDITIPSREDGRDIPCRVFYPSARKTNEERSGLAVLCHIHGGGWIFGSEKQFDPLLQLYADMGDLAVVSVGYRHAPENPYPAPVEDCLDATEWLVQNAVERFGGPLKFFTGESAGAHLAAVSLFHLLRTYPDFVLQGGMIFNYGCFDLSGTPSALSFNSPLVLSTRTMQSFIDAFLADPSIDRKDSKISPLYEDFKAWRGRLPPALFAVGTDDALLDDTVFMSSKWSMAGADATVKVYEGSPHGYTAFAASGDENAKKGLGDIAMWIRTRLSK